MPPVAGGVAVRIVGQVNRAWNLTKVLRHKETRLPVLEPLAWDTERPKRSQIATTA